MKRFVRGMQVVAGTFCVVFGLVGIFIPVLPTTPFLLLAAFFYARSSERFSRWLLTNQWFGTYIRDYREGRGMPLREKVLTMVALWLSIGLAAWYAVPIWWGRLLLVTVAVGVTVHLVRIRTVRTVITNRDTGPATVAKRPDPGEE